MEAKKEAMGKPIYDLFVDAEGELARQLKFLGVAVSNDETRYFMNFLQIEVVEEATEERLYPILRGVATDGRRLHIVEPLSSAAPVIYGMAAGRYRVVSTKGSRVQLARRTEAPGDYPNWRKVLPDGMPRHTTEFNGFCLHGYKGTGSVPDLLRMFREFPEPTAINLTYLVDLGMGESWKVRWYDPRHAVEFVSGPKRAVIMPMHAD